MTNPREREGFDLDMLTNEEKEDIGMDPENFKFQPEPNSNPKFNSEPKQKCCFCNRKMKNPVSKFEKYGIDFIPEGEEAHEGCARRQFEIVKDQLKQLEEND